MARHGTQTTPRKSGKPGDDPQSAKGPSVGADVTRFFGRASEGAPSGGRTGDPIAAYVCRMASYNGGTRPGGHLCPATTLTSRRHVGWRSTVDDNGTHCSGLEYPFDHAPLSETVGTRRYV